MRNFILCQDHKKAIYIIKNLNNRKLYIGQTQDTYKRSRQHYNALKYGIHNKAMQKDYNSGCDFRFDVFKELPPETDRETLLKLEREYITICIEQNIILYNSDALTLYAIEKHIEDMKRKRQQEIQRKIVELREIEYYSLKRNGLYYRESERVRDSNEIARYFGY